jgi:hypothetical protein
MITRRVVLISNCKSKTVKRMIKLINTLRNDEYVTYFDISNALKLGIRGIQSAFSLNQTYFKKYSTIIENDCGGPLRVFGKPKAIKQLRKLSKNIYAQTPD